jgi:hypothetical protein
LTARTWENLGVLVRGAILAPGARTVTGCLRAAWPWVTKHWSAYENVLRRARLDMRVLARELFRQILELLPPQAVVELIVDESLVRRYGPWVVEVGMHRDAVRSSHARNAVSPGHKWVTLAVAVRLPFAGCALALPVLSVLYSTRKHARRNRAKRLYRKHRTVTELALLLVRMVVRWAPDRRFRLVGDGTYGTHGLADALNPASRHPSLRRVTLVSRFPMDGATYAPPPPYSGRGRPRLKGARLPSPRQVASDPETAWSRVTVEWYGGTRKAVLVCSRTGLWYRPGSTPTPVRWVVVRDPKGKRRDEAFFTTDVELSARAVVEAYVRRWPLETTFEETRAHLGLETLRNRAPNAVRRSAPLVLALYSLIVTSFAKHVDDPDAWKQSTPWYRKPHVTFSDMLGAARRAVLGEILDERVSSRPGLQTAESKVLEPHPALSNPTHIAIDLPA